MSCVPYFLSSDTGTPNIYQESIVTLCYLKFCASVLATTNIPSPLETAKELIN
jgi:hypothetical protein